MRGWLKAVSVEPRPDVVPGRWVFQLFPQLPGTGEYSRRMLDFNFFVKNALAESLKPSQWLRTTYESPYQRYK
jgi:hypothetical protein